MVWAPVKALSFKIKSKISLKVKNILVERIHEECRLYMCMKSNDSLNSNDLPDLELRLEWELKIENENFPNLMQTFQYCEGRSQVMKFPAELFYRFRDQETAFEICVQRAELLEFSVSNR